MLKTMVTNTSTKTATTSCTPILSGSVANQNALKAGKIAQIESILLTYPLWNGLLEEIDHCRTHSKVSAEPLCMFIGGAPGSGKTTLQHCYKEMFGAEQNTVPVLLVRAPARGTEKKLVTAMLRSIGDPGAQFGSVDAQTARLRNLMDDFRVEIVLIDEFQQFVDKDNFRVLQNQCDWVKDLIDNSRRAFVFSGMPWAVDILEKSENEQLRRRIPIRERLEPFGWKTKEEKIAFRAFLKKLESKLPLSERSRLASLSTAFRFFCATNGRVGKVMTLVRRAAEIAVLEEFDSLDLKILARAYRDRLMADYPNRPNPFNVEIETLKPLPFEDYMPSLNKVSRRKGGNRKVNISGVLRK